MQIRERNIREIIVLDLAGSLDFNSAPTLKVKLEALIRFGHNKIVVNLADVDLIDSTGIGSLMYGLKILNPVNGDIKIVGLSHQNKNVFSVLELDRVFSIVPTEDQAIRSFLEDGSTIH